MPSADVAGRQGGRFEAYSFQFREQPAVALVLFHHLPQRRHLFAEGVGRLAQAQRLLGALQR